MAGRAVATRAAAALSSGGARIPALPPTSSRYLTRHLRVSTAGPSSGQSGTRRLATFSCLSSSDSDSTPTHATAKPSLATQSSRRPPPERVVLLTGLPATATPNDIRRLTGNDASGQHFHRIEFLRTLFFNPSGKALVYFSTDSSARRFQRACSKRILGANVLDSRCMSDAAADNLLAVAYSRHPRHLQLPLDLVHYESGKLVLLRGLPSLTTEDKMQTKLSRTYDLMETGWWRGKRRSNAGYKAPRKPGFDPVSNHALNLGPVLRLHNIHEDASTAAFLIRLRTTAEAMRLARMWHNSYFTPQRFNVDETGGRYRIEAHVIY
ncbi:uncharacterized protein PFL1_02888 [Pseudozyma flocculosa PF-1]|uniref:RRM domain-containing protein n=2 Tax=Pseudozyma flocculosa TaxID=84751 RepID=A0A5C3F2K2_9BASI|nr:uncharacterized protein PFL1_02888 [Pseudozyma flocculosa PF-1]EPQ29668.1 hypothetical protein PFL1_02888 [Pseudozyma flocculosa PF-1]SPO38235.1 uncharacterized protein PSFLO_03712 [Pseudozyma flocculosa]